MEMKEKEIKLINVDLSCDLQCEGCEKFFDCTRPERQETYMRGRMELARQKMEKIKRKIIVVGGKGGVGKTIIAVNMATSLAMKGRKVTVMDQNLDGPCVPKMFGLEGKRLLIGEKGIIPAETLLGIQVMSTGLILGEDEVLTWFDEMRRNATEEFLTHVDYGERDYLITDLPAGTSADSINVLQYIPEADGAVIVTIPSDVSQGVAKRATILVNKAKIRTLGIVENMSGFQCPDCGEEIEVLQTGGGQSLAKETGVPFLGKIPLDPRLSICSDEGIPFVYKYPDIPASKVMMEIIDKIEEMVGFGR